MHSRHSTLSKGYHTGCGGSKSVAARPGLHRWARVAVHTTKLLGTGSLLFLFGTGVIHRVYVAYFAYFVYLWPTPDMIFPEYDTAAVGLHTAVVAHRAPLRRWDFGERFPRKRYSHRLHHVVQQKGEIPLPSRIISGLCLLWDREPVRKFFEPVLVFLWI